MRRRSRGATLDPEDWVQSINLCGDTYKVTTADGPCLTHLAMRTASSARTGNGSFHKLVAACWRSEWIPD
jgi:hypothetical protein